MRHPLEDTHSEWHGTHSRSPLSIVQEAREFVRSADLSSQAQRFLRPIPTVSCENTLDLCRASSAASIATTAPSATGSSFARLSSLPRSRSSTAELDLEDSTRKSSQKKSRTGSKRSTAPEPTTPGQIARSRNLLRANSIGSLGSYDLNGTEIEHTETVDDDSARNEVSVFTPRLAGAWAHLKDIGKSKRKKKEKDRKEDKFEARADPDARAVKGATWTRGELLGRGSLGSVWKAVDKKTGEVMAVKEVVVDSLDNSDREFSQSLQVEIDLYKQLKHPNIVSYLGNDRIRDRLYIYLEFMSGGSVSQVLHREGPMAEPLIACYGRQLLEGLDYLHTREPTILHRDVKGGNILVGENRVVKLSDFGCSKRSDDTANHTLRGSIPWMAPEVMNERAYGRKADLWSLGCVFIEMATAKPPWGPMTNPLATMVRVATTEETPPIDVPVSESFRDIISICTRRAPQDRLLACELMDHPFLAE
ncbi:unnamed protein product [Effrenium voratum]|nr:unnamed protein product [Effrenium voratum]